MLGKKKVNLTKLPFNPLIIFQRGERVGLGGPPSKVKADGVGVSGVAEAA